MASELQACCLCAEQAPEAIKYTDCCSQPVCVDCQNDFRGSNADTAINCLACGFTINQLIDPTTLVTTRYNSQLEDCLSQLEPMITTYTAAIATLRQHLDSHCDNLAKIRGIITSDKDQTPPALTLDSEHHRVIKPLTKTIQDNTMILTSLRQLKKQLLALTGQGHSLVQHGRLIQLNHRVTGKVLQPATMLISLAWYCRHPLGARLVATEPLTRVTECNWGRQIIKLEPLIERIKDIYSQEVKQRGHNGYDGHRWQHNDLVIDKVVYEEIQPGQFVLLLTIRRGWVFVCPRPSGKKKVDPEGDPEGNPGVQPSGKPGDLVKCYLTNCRTDSVRISANYLVYQKLVDSAKLSRWQQNQPAKVVVWYSDFTRSGGVVADPGVTGVNGVEVTTILTLERNQLWCYCQVSQELRCYQLVLSNDLSNDTASLSLIKVIPTSTVLSYHSGIYCSIHHRSAETELTNQSQPTAEDSPTYYRINSVNYPQAVIETTREPHLFRDGTVVYHSHNKVVTVCNRENLTSPQLFGHDENCQWHHNPQIGSDGNLIEYFLNGYGNLVLKRQRSHRV